MKEQYAFSLLTSAGYPQPELLLYQIVGYFKVGLRMI